LVPHPFLLVEVDGGKTTAEGWGLFDEQSKQGTPHTKRKGLELGVADFLTRGKARPDKNKSQRAKKKTREGLKRKASLAREGLRGGRQGKGSKHVCNVYVLRRGINLIKLGEGSKGEKMRISFPSRK